MKMNAGMAKIELFSIHVASFEIPGISLFSFPLLVFSLALLYASFAEI